MVGCSTVGCACARCTARELCYCDFHSRWDKKAEWQYRKGGFAFEKARFGKRKRVGGLAKARFGVRKRVEDFRKFAKALFAKVSKTQNAKRKTQPVQKAKIRIKGRGLVAVPELAPVGRFPLPSSAGGRVEVTHLFLNSIYLPNRSHFPSTPPQSCNIGPSPTCTLHRNSDRTMCRRHATMGGAPGYRSGCEVA